MVTVAVKMLEHAKDLPLPAYASEGASGVDVHAAVDELIHLPAGQHILVPCGFGLAVPSGYEAQIRSRSGLALRFGIFVLNGLGTIDSDYRGEIKVILANFSNELYSIKRGQRIAQLVIVPVVTTCWLEVEDLPDTRRGNGGFGSTGE